VATCATCGNALCADCIVRTGVGIKCRSCTGVKAVKPAKPAKAEKEPAAPARVPASAGTRAPLATSGGRRRPWAVPLVAGGVIVLAVAGFGLVSRDSSSPVSTEQTQVTPAAFTERQSEFVGAGGQRIGGTLTLPGAGDGLGVPAVLIVPGLGALDRNSVVAANPPDALRDALVSTVGAVGLSSGDPLYRDLSESLARAGVASFRYDRRGMQPIPLRDGQKLSLDDEVTDARAALDLLGSRQEVLGAPLGIVGHDTGAVVATRLAAGNIRVKAVVAISLASRPLADVLAADLARSRGAPVAEAFKSAVATLASSGKAPPADTLPDFIRPIFASGHDAYLAAVLAADPMVAVNRVDQPVLLVRGGGDPAVTAEDAARLSSSLRTGGQVMVGSSDADHNLTLAGAGHEHSNTPTAQVTHRDTDVFAGLTTWVKANLAG
jgi:pimeloyl-ACP methyl ester carboxylesterase